MVEQQLPVGDKAERRRDVLPEQRYRVPCKKTGEEGYAENDGDEPGQQPAGRRAQNWRMAGPIGPLAPIRSNSRPVIKNPDTTKKMSTPR